MRPLGAGVGCVPAEVVGVFVLNLCVGREKKIWFRLHKDYVELHSVLADKMKRVTWNSGCPIPASGLHRKEMSVERRVCCSLLYWEPLTYVSWIRPS